MPGPSDGIRSSSLGCIACVHVIKQNKPVLHVQRPEGDWIFLCDGKVHSSQAQNDHSELLAVHVLHLVKKDASLQAILNLGCEMEANRQSIGGPWQVSQLEPE